MAEKSKQSKSIFDDKYYYLKIPREVSELRPRLTCAEQFILSRITYWTRKGMPCTHTNAQFAELIGCKDSRFARRIVNRLIKRKLVDIYCKNKRSRELTSLFSVDGKHVIARKASQVFRGEKGRVNRPPSAGSIDPPKPEKAGSINPPTTTENKTKEQLRPEPPSPAEKRASPARPTTGKQRRRLREERERLSELEIANRIQKNRKALLAMG